MGVDVNQINLSPEPLQQGGQGQLVVPPDEQVAEIIPVGGLRFPQQPLGLAPVPRLIDGLNALQGEGRSGQLNGPPVAVFIILPLPNQFGLQPR